MNRRLKKFISAAFIRGVRAATRIPLIGRAVVASFDAVRQTWGDRSWLFQSLQDAWQEMDALTRMELQRIHESLIENSCIVWKIRELYLQFSVGPSGLICTPNASRWEGPDNSGDEKKRIEQWNHAYAESWERWWRAPELNDTVSGAQLTRIWSGLLFDRGEIFVHLTEETASDAKGVIRSRTPKVETIDAHRCCSPEGQREYQGNVIIDGRELTPQGKTVAYWFKKTNFNGLLTGGIAAGPDEFRRIEVLDKRGRRKLLHKYKYRRPGQLRGLPEGVSVFNLVRDNMDLHKLEMQAAKLASNIANVETNPGGELSTRANRQVNMRIGTQTPAGTTVTKNVPMDYKVSIGSSTIALKSGDKLDQFMISRPTVATQDYWDLHYTLICIGYNISKTIVMPASLQGTVTRADLDVSSYGFGREHFDILRELLTEVYEWRTEWAKDFDRTMDGEFPADYLGVIIKPPRAPNVDVGYTAKAEEIKLRLGIKTVPDVYSEQQMDWRLKTREAFEYQKYLDDCAKEFGIAAARVSELALDELALMSAKSQKPGGGKETEDDPEEVPA